MKALEWNYQPLQAASSNFKNFPNFVPAAHFAQVLLLDRKRELRGAGRIFVLKISVKNRNQTPAPLPGYVYTRLAQVLYLNIRQADYWSCRAQTFFLVLVNCNLKEATHCKQRLESVFQHAFTDGLAKPVAISLELVSVDETIEVFQDLREEEKKKSNAGLLPGDGSRARFSLRHLWHLFLLKGMLPLVVQVGFGARELVRYRFFKRLLDLFLSVLLIVVCLPAFVGIALAIYVENPGPVIFKQKRVGFQGRPFHIYKFRTMRTSQNPSRDHEQLVAKILSGKENAQELAQEYQAYIRSRTTRVGRFLRKTSLDELPQLWNVLRNEMSLVGPRPHPDYEVRRYRDWYRQRLLAKPGLTGLSKVQMRFSPENYEDSIRLDIRYIRNWSLKEDLRILFKTARVMFVDYE
ncbi:MAG: sugar transferase [Calditrichaeota bacterium]|nr:MAG: sugar transferase [Calditrichota bacterium]